MRERHIAQERGVSFAVHAAGSSEIFMISVKPSGIIKIKYFP